MRERGYARLGVTSANLKDGLEGRLRLIKEVLRIKLGLLGKKQEEKRKGEVKHEKEMVGGGSMRQGMVVLPLFMVELLY